MASCSLLRQPPTQETLVQLKSTLSSLDGGNKTSLNRKGRGEEGELLIFVSYTNETFSETLLVNQWTGFGRRVTFRCESHEETHTWETIIHLVLTTFSRTLGQTLVAICLKINTEISGIWFLKSSWVRSQQKISRTTEEMLLPQ